MGRIASNQELASPALPDDELKKRQETELKAARALLGRNEVRGTRIASNHELSAPDDDLALAERQQVELRAARAMIAQKRAEPYPGRPPIVGRNQ